MSEASPEKGPEAGPEKAPEPPAPAAEKKADIAPAKVELPGSSGHVELVVPPGDAPPTEHPSFLFLALVSVFVLVSDLGSKWWAVKTLEKDGFRLPAKEIIKGRLAFILARNPGGAWGMLHDQPEKVRKPFFVAVSLIAVVVIVGMFRKLDPKQRALKWGLPLVLGGALGNLVDRIRYGQVIDFIDVVYWKKKIGVEMHWPTFNVADIAICVGVLLMAVDFLFPHKRPTPPRVVPKPAAAAAPPPSTTPAP